MIPYSTQSINQDDIDAVTAVLNSSHLTQGKEVEAFEKALADYVGVKHAIVLNSATSALLAAYHAVGLQEGDEVITTPISFVATSNMIIACGAKPVFCDVRLDGNIDESRIEALITPKTKAIAAVDFAGKPVEHGKIRDLADRHGLRFIDDASHALGSYSPDGRVGTLADLSVFSFHAIKPITTGEGGAVVTDNDTFAEHIRLFRSHGITKKALWNSDMSTMGYNFRMTDIAAALGNSQLKRLDAFIERRNEIAAFYDEQFSGHRLFMPVTLPEGVRSSRHLYPVILAPELHCPKEDIFTALHQAGIGVQVHYKPIYKNSFYQKRYGEQRLSVTEDFYRSELSLPCHQGMNNDETNYVAKKFLEVVESYSHRGCSF
jgi:UDP-4-amino-4,6-dideoxy-L-N-acetyl-beta-L-altrosamine transaminase